MASKMTRRALLATALGAGQFALLDRLGLLRAAHADPGPDAPIKLVVLYLPGGMRFYPEFVPMSDADVARTIPPPTSVLSEPVFFRPADLITLEGDSGGFAPLRIPRGWNPADPGDRTGYRYSPMGYGWLQYALGPTTAVLHGIDQGSFAHGSAYVAAMCGIPSSDYRAPALVSVVANYLHGRYAATRAIPCIAISSSGVPKGTGLPPSASPAIVPSAGALSQFYSSDGATHAQWASCNGRTPTDVTPFAGTGAVFEHVGLTNVDALLLARTRALRGASSSGTDAVLEQIHDGYAAISRTFANDVVAAVQGATPTTLPLPAYLRGYRGQYQFTFGLANGDLDMTQSIEWVLRLLKSDITSAVYASLPEMYYDFHNASSVPRAVASTRAQLDIVARMLGEMKATPSRERPGKTLYDDTLVVVLSEFNRSWMRGPNQDSLDGWQFPDDHNPITSVLLSGGGIAGNRQIGGFTQPAAQGLPVAITERSGTTGQRPPTAADFVATVASLFGMVPDRDFDLPGNWGVINGLAPA